MEFHSESGFFLGFWVDLGLWYETNFTEYKFELLFISNINMGGWCSFCNNSPTQSTKSEKMGDSFELSFTLNGANESIRLTPIKILEKDSRNSGIKEIISNSESCDKSYLRYYQFRGLETHWEKILEAAERRLNKR